jgi:tRNA(Ile)-lysidine synthase
MLRGAWTEGLGGISPVVRCDGEQRIVRPMLGVRRSEIEAFLRERGQPWREDATNADLAMTRNRVRHDLMPKLRTYNPGVDALLARTAEVAREEEAFWQAEVARILPQILLPGKAVRGGGRAVSTGVHEAVYAVEIARLAAMPPALRRRVLREVAKQVDAKANDGRVGRYVLSSDETAKVLALAGFGAYECVSGGSVKGRIGSRLELHAGLRVERTAREVRFWKEL